VAAVVVVVGSCLFKDSAAADKRLDDADATVVFVVLGTFVAPVDDDA